MSLKTRFVFSTFLLLAPALLFACSTEENSFTAESANERIAILEAQVEYLRAERATIQEFMDSTSVDMENNEEATTRERRYQHDRQVLLGEMLAQQMRELEYARMLAATQGTIKYTNH